MIDTSIIGRLQPVQIESPVNALAKMLQVREMQQSGDMNALKMADYRSGVERKAKYNSLLGQDYASPEARENALLKGGFAEEALKFGTDRRANAKSDVDMQKSQLEAQLKKFEVAGQIISGVKDQASWDLARQQTAQVFGVEAAAQMPAQYDPALIEQKRLQAMTIKDQVAAKHQQLVLAETTKHNRTTEGLTAQGQQITMRGQNMTDTRSRELNAITKEATAEAKKVGAIDKGVTALSNTLQKEGIPELETAVSGAEGALGRYPKGQVPGVGAVKNALPAFMMSDEGKDVRQALAQVRNIVLSARSGAAVTDQELRRLVEEIGTGVGMSEDDIRKGLAKVRTRIDSIKTNAAAGVNDDVLGTYQQRGGIPIKRGAKAAAPAVNIDSLLDKYK